MLPLSRATAQCCVPPWRGGACLPARPPAGAIAGAPIVREGLSMPTEATAGFGASQLFFTDSRLALAVANHRGERVRATPA